ncbi:MAG: GIY-YIG nuclease family protein [Bacteroidetes bacterium]|nr:GIY-YIG nuclease family protein [Bacteroidota bacterium]
MYNIYIFHSKSRNRFYTGHSEDVGYRFIRHNQGRSNATMSGRPWRLVYAEQFRTRSEAVQCEKEIKAMNDRDYIIDLIKKYSA